MQLNHSHKQGIVNAYCVIFYLLLVYKWFNGMLLCQLQPVLFITRPDVFSWVFMQNGLHLWLLKNTESFYILDGLFYSAPLLYCYTFYKQPRFAPLVAIYMLIVNVVYVQCYTLFPANSIESFTAWLLFPLLFIAVQMRSFYLVLHALRYFFLFVFVSAAVWKGVQGGLFNPRQMSGVLLYQHAAYLATSSGYWFSRFIYWLINHSLIGYALYLSAAVLEFSFVTGYFTLRYDRLLIAAFIVFLVLDHFLMRIPYWELLPFVLTLVYSRYSMPEIIAPNH